MNRALRSTLLAAVTLGVPCAAETPLAVHTDLVFYGDNTEFFNPFRTGETTLGAYGRGYLSARPSEKVEVRGGIFGNQRFGSDKAFEHIRPVLAVLVGKPGSRFVIGTLEVMRRADGPGPDRGGPHGLLPPLQVEVLSFTRPYEAGLQWLVDKDRVRNDVWIDWQHVIGPGQPEVFDAGTNGRVRVAKSLWLAVQLHEVHHGGQLFDVHQVGDSFAAAGGALFEPRINGLKSATLELYGVRTVDHPNRGLPDKETGSGVLARAAAVRGGWRGHAIFWSATNARKVEGDPNYLSLREDGTVVRARRYEELGITRAFGLAEGVALEASGRLHWIEGKLEYSYRVLAVLGLEWPVVRKRP
jgi:hypothetical protein